MATRSALENYFSSFRPHIIGDRQTFESPFGEQKIIYADWTATAKAYGPIEEYLQKEIMPFLANTHTGASITGTLMARAYEKAKGIIKQHVNAGGDDALIFCGSGMTAAVNKLQRILGLRIPERVGEYVKKDNLQVHEILRPVVFVTHMEHHSNHTSWLETIATVEIIRPDEYGNVNLAHFRSLLEKFKHRKNKIAAITACSNVTGIETPYHEIAKLIHEYDGLCFVDFACSAPYVDVDMHPAEKGAYLDAIYFSSHKFLGGAGTPGILIFCKNLYKNTVPDQPGGGTLLFTDPWNARDYVPGIEQREDGGTPPFMQGIKAALCIRLKEQMGVENIRHRESEILQIIFDKFATIKNIHVLEERVKKRLGVISFMIPGLHYNLAAKILNDRFGIQVRGGCSCAGTYGHLLLDVDKARSVEIHGAILSGNLLQKPGWIRLSVHPVMSDAEINFIMDAIALTATHFKEWMKDYAYNPELNEFIFKGFAAKEREKVEEWFKFNMAGWETPLLACVM